MDRDRERSEAKRVFEEAAEAVFERERVRVLRTRVRLRLRVARFVADTLRFVGVGERLGVGVGVEDGLGGMFAITSHSNSRVGACGLLPMGQVNGIGGPRTTMSLTATTASAPLAAMLRMSSMPEGGIVEAP